MNPLHAGARFVFGKLAPKWPYPVLRGPLRGCRYLLGATAGAAGGVSVHLGIQEVEQSQCLIKFLQAGQVFFDVGANVGFYSLLGARIVQSKGRVVAFEPFPRNLAFLYRHIELNKVKNVTILPFACADQFATEKFLRGENHALGHLDTATASETKGPVDPAAMLVATISLDEAAEKLGLCPDVMKIDVEGAELRVLRGAAGILAQMRPVLLLSAHSDELRRACLLYLSEMAYRVEPLNSEEIETATEFLALPKNGSGARKVARSEGA